MIWAKFQRLIWRAQYHYHIDQLYYRINGPTTTSACAYFGTVRQMETLLELDRTYYYFRKIR
jgi:hypothetical protein